MEISPSVERSEQRTQTHGLGNLTQSQVALLVVVWCMFGGLAGVALFALQAANRVQFATVFATSALIAAACTLSGAILGFLFGIPKTLQQAHTGGRVPGQDGEGAGTDAVCFQANTNLEQISDWLTKILVGVGLTEISSVPSRLDSYARSVAAGLGNGPGAAPFAVAILVFYSACGFLVSYLWTRLYFAAELKRNDPSSRIADVEGRVSAIESQAKIDEDAMTIVQRQINLAPGAPDIKQPEIDTAIRRASSAARTQVYYLARAVRQANWKEAQNKAVMERTIAVFKGLANNDLNDHLSRGQLGYALKDQRKPAWAEAAKALTDAITLRGPWQSTGWLYYEFNRALCGINMYQSLEQGSEPQEQMKKQIIADLKAATSDPWLRDLILENPTIRDWLTLNQIKL